MTENNNNSLLNKEINSLPESIKVYLFSERFDQDTQKISEELSLNDTQKKALESEIVLILMGLEDLENTVINLQKTFPEDSKFLEIFDKVLSLTDPFIDDIVEINIRHNKEAEEGNLKKSVPVPPPNPAPVTENTETVANNDTQNINNASEGLTYNNN
jgi:hypothetical protein